eukprot:1130660-Prorocentrum_minimum.AAC.13
MTTYHQVAAYQPGDVPLGQFLRAALPGKERKCVDAKCGEGPEAHVRTYMHGTLRLTLRVSEPGVRVSNQCAALTS